MLKNQEPKLFRVRNKTTKELTGAIFFKHTCNVCGSPASFGKNVSLVKFLKTHAEGKPNYKHLGEWTCGMSGCKNV